MAWASMSGSHYAPQGGSLQYGVIKDYDLTDDDIDPCYQYNVPLCGPAMCTSKGMLPIPLARPGIDCVCGDRPCLPCDIVNIKLRIAVGPWLNRAVAECQKRYFCRVWNILFSWLFPDHKTVPCRNLRSGDKETACRRKLSAPDKARPTLPYGGDPRRIKISPEEKIKAVPKVPVIALDDGDKLMPEEDWPPSPPPSSPASSVVAKSNKLSTKRRSRGYLRYNIWGIPMPDTSKAAMPDTSKDNQQVD